MENSPVTEEIISLIKNNDIVLFMKGTALTPMCGFSGVVCHILSQHGVEFEVVNVLDHPGIREGIKEYANWPTIPQLYIKQEFIGGSDIIREMHENGELVDLLKTKGLSSCQSSVTGLQ